MRIALFATCIVDAMYPKVALATVRILERLGEKVQLAAGLDQDDHLDEAAQERGLACLSRFGQQLAGVEPRRMRIVATNALRVAWIE